jgi:hypothetical protein
MLRRPHAVILTALTWLPRGYGVDPSLNSYSFCIRYYGSVSAEVDLPDTIPTYNYNQTTICPRSFNFPNLSGATLTICPPSSSLSDDDPVAISAELRFRDVSGELTGPIDNLRLSPRLITNGSTVGPFASNGKPAIIAHDPGHEISSLSPVWTINGTQAALTDSPDADDRTNSVYFGCRYEHSPYYCGGFEDRHAPDGGCWDSQWILFNMHDPLNFTYRFSNDEASVYLWARSPLALSDDEAEQGRNIESNSSSVYIVFGGNREVPSVVDYDFWTNSESDYEIETTFAAERQGLNFELGDDGGPVFMNETKQGGDGEGYAVGNGTAVSESAAPPISQPLMHGISEAYGWALTLVMTAIISACITPQ